jgi:hypothetical protein
MTIQELNEAIDTAVPPHGGPKVTAPSLNATLHAVVETLAAPAPRRYEEVLHFPAQPLFADTIFEASTLVRLTAGPGVAQVDLALGTADFQPLLVAPATEYAPSVALPLPVGNLTYRVTFAPGVSYAALKQIIQVS